MDPIIISVIIAGVGGLINLISGYMEGEISKEQFDREMEFKEKELNETIKLKTKELGLKESEIRQEWDKFVNTLDEQKKQFSATYGLKKAEFDLSKYLGEEELKLKKDTLEHQKYMDIINPIMERRRRSNNLMQAFSGIAGLKKEFPSTQAKPLHLPSGTATQQPINPILETGYAPNNPITRSV